MRCLVGIILFLALYFSSCAIVGGLARTFRGPAGEAETLRKYHPIVAVGCGVVAIAGCSLPWLLTRPRDFDEWNP